MQVVIAAGGKGSRLKQVTADLPKPMVEIAGKPLLEHQVMLARKHGIRDVLLLTGYGAEQIEQYFGDGAAWNVRIDYQRETQPLGSAGALLNAFDKLQETFFVLYGDTILNVDLRRMAATHSANASATLFVHPNDHPQDSDLVELGDANEIVAMHSYPHPAGYSFPNLVNAALYVFSKRALRPFLHYPFERSAPDICKHLFPAMKAQGGALYGYRSREYIKDAGTVERLERVRRHYESGRVAAGSLETPVPAVFLDRDGTLNYERGWLNSAGMLELLPGAAEAVRAINDSGRMAVIVTNQPVVARGECTEQELHHIHNRLEWLLGEAHAYADAIYYCPHHPDAGFPGERVDLKVSCHCRKPAAGMLEAAARDLHLDIDRSWIIGDSEADVTAAANFGIRSVLVRHNQTAFQDSADWPGGPSHKADNVLEAVDYVLCEGRETQ
jgi:D,D-heptose 1,7-bisphosphate phosphatase